MQTYRKSLPDLSHVTGISAAAASTQVISATREGPDTGPPQMAGLLTGVILVPH